MLIDGSLWRLLVALRDHYHWGWTTASTTTVCVLSQNLQRDTNSAGELQGNDRHSTPDIPKTCNKISQWLHLKQQQKLHFSLDPWPSFGAQVGHTSSNKACNVIQFHKKIPPLYYVNKKVAKVKINRRKYHITNLLALKNLTLTLILLP